MENFKGKIKKIAMVAVFAVVGFAFASAQTQWYRATSYAYKFTNSYGNWMEWSDWIKCDIAVKLDLDTDMIVIYSNKTQIYAVYDYNGRASDGNGGVYAEYRVIDQDYDKGKIRLRVERNGNSQLYVDFADVMWVYNVQRTR